MDEEVIIRSLRRKRYEDAIDILSKEHLEELNAILDWLSSD